jgi:hypothetical protein
MGRPKLTRWYKRWIKASANNPWFAKSRAAKEKARAESAKLRAVRKAMKEAKFE